MSTYECIMLWALSRLKVANGVMQISDHMDMDRDDSDEAKTAAIGQARLLISDCFFLPCHPDSARLKLQKICLQVLAVGEQVWVKVVDVKEDPGGKFSHKIGVSIKLVDQRDGTDHDPHGLKYKPRRGDEGGFGARRPVGADVGQVQQGESRARDADFASAFGHVEPRLLHLSTSNNASFVPHCDSSEA